MILRDGTDTREATSTPGRFVDGLAVVLDRLYMDGDAGDDMLGIEAMGESGVRYGRRVLWTSSTGFVSSDRYANADEAQEALEEAFPGADESDDES
jgi:hypothetical protein